MTIGIFINPGHEGEQPPQKPFAGSNRSFEYNTLSDQYARFLLEEILPEVGKRYNLSDDPNDRAIAGASSGGICDAESVTSAITSPPRPGGHRRWRPPRANP